MEIENNQEINRKFCEHGEAAKPGGAGRGRRRKGEGSLIERNGRWVMRWREDGRLVQEATEFKVGAKADKARLVADLGEAGIGRKAKGAVLPGIAERYGRGAAAGISKAVERVMERAGIATSERREGWGRARPTASFHSLRHTFVTRAIEAGVPAAIVRALVGHATAAMTEHYTHVSAAAMVEAFARMG